MKYSPLLDNKLLAELAVVDWGYTEDPVPFSYSKFEAWISAKRHGNLHYLSDHRQKLRSDLRQVYPEFHSALVFLFSYQSTKKWMLENDQHALAAYTLGFEGEDYHWSLRERLFKIAQSLGLEDSEFFLSIDAQPVLERDLAFRAGLGWFGKNSMLIHRKEGSYFIIGSLLLNRKLPVETSPLETDHCGHCRACVDACPTNAIDPETRTLNAQQCISTFTIELFKESPPPAGFDQSRGEIFGCDICQDVCPWNKKSLLEVSAELKLKESFMFLKEWFYQWPKEKLRDFFENESNRGVRKKLRGTPFDRPGREGWLKNLK